MFSTSQLARSACAALLVGSGLLFACSDSSQDETVFGPTVGVGGGTVRSYVETSAGDAVEIGVRVSDLALTGLPNIGTVFLIPLPVQSSVAPYKHVTLNWNPAGHPPAPFSVPHFDAHFYSITETERIAIASTDPEFATKAANTPAAEFSPVGYDRDAGAVPNMGTHWVDHSSPEFNGQPFTKTFIYGSWNGAFTFYEPMFAKALLDSKSEVVTTSIKLPAKYATPGMYPTSYKVGYDAKSKEWVIALSGLVSH